MKIYAVFIINKVSGDIESCITSDAPISSEMIPEHLPYQTPIKTIPKTPKITYRHCYCEFDSNEFCRGREALENCEMSGKDIKATVTLKQNSTISNIVETNEKTMLKDHDKRKKEQESKFFDNLIGGISNG